MKDPFDRTKVVLRHLPPAISQSVLMEQVDGRFASRYKWLCFLPGKNSQKNQRYSRAYIEFKRPEDVLEFAEFFDGHIFVNEKGTQFKTLVEYAPSQRVPKAWSKKDGREGTIFKDPEYLEFLDLISKPTENLPSAEIQLERKEAERAGGPKEALIVTPLMDFVRQKRATKSGQRSSANGKISKRSGGVSAGSSSPASSKRGSEKRRVPQPMYVLRDTTKSGSGKDKSMFILASRQEEQQLSDKSGVVAAARGTELLEDVTSTNGTISGVSGGVETGKRRIVLLKGKERENSNQHTVASPIKNLAGSTASKHSQRQEGSGRIIKSILSKEMRPSQSPSALYQSEQQLQTLSLDKERRPPRPPNPRGVFKDHTGISSLASISDGDSKRSQDNKTSGYDLHGSVSVGEKQDKRTRNKDRPDRGVWTPLRRSDGSHASDDSLSSSSMAAHVLPDSLEGTPVFQQLAGSSKIGDEDLGNQVARLGSGNSLLPARDVLFSHGDTRGDMPSSSRSGEGKSQGGGRGGHSLVENGSHRHVGRHGPLHGVREADGSLIISDAKLSKRGGATGYGSHEKRVWVQKSGSGS